MKPTTKWVIGGAALALVLLLWLLIIGGPPFYAFGTTPGFRRQHRTEICTRWLGQIAGAKDAYARDKQLTNGVTVTYRDLVANGYLKVYLFCPSAGLSAGQFGTAEGTRVSYDVRPIGQAPRCKIQPDTHMLTDGCQMGREGQTKKAESE